MADPKKPSSGELEQAADVVHRLLRYLEVTEPHAVNDVGKLRDARDLMEIHAAAD